MYKFNETSEWSNDFIVCRMTS